MENKNKALRENTTEGRIYKRKQVRKTRKHALDQETWFYGNLLGIYRGKIVRS